MRREVSSCSGAAIISRRSRTSACHSPKSSATCARVPWIADAAAVALDDGKRQFIGAVVQLTATGRAEVSHRGKRAFNEALRSALRARIEPIAVPRKIRHVDAIPVDSQGKRQPGTLRELFARR